MILLKKKNILEIEETVTGENIEIKDKDIAIKSLTIDGRSTQETRSGKNKIPTNESEWEQGTINGGNNEDSTIRLRTKNYIEINDDTLHIFHLENALIGNVWFYDEQKQVVNNLYDMIYQTGMKSVEFTTPKNTKYYKVVIRYEDNSVITSQAISEIKPQLELGSTATEYEPYGASPSPDYPSEIESVGYENLFNKDDSITQGKYFGSAGEYRTSETDFVQETYIKVNPNTTYTISSNSSIACRIIEYTSDKTFIQRDARTDVKYTITTTNETEYVRLSCAISGLDSIIFEKGSVAHSYIPYGKSGIEVKTVGKNLFDKDNVINGYYYNEDLVYTAYSGIKMSDYIKVKPNENITFSFNASGSSAIRINYFNSNRVIQNQITYRTNDKTLEYKNTFVIPNDIYYMRISFIQVVDADSMKIEAGSVATEYTPYQERITVMQLNAPLRSLPNGVKDIAYIKNNKLYVDRYIKSIVLNGSEKFVYNSVNDYIRTTSGYINDNMINNDIIITMSDYFVSCSFNNRGTGTNPRIYFENNLLCFKNSGFTNETDFKTWLSNNNVQVDYALATPVTEEIGDITIPELLDGENNISNSENANMKIEYVNYTPEIFEFNTILQSGYKINEQPNLIAKRQFTNGKRKKIITSYNDVVISINLGCFDGNTLARYLSELQDGEYQYYSLKDKTMKNANFIVTLPELQIDNSSNEVIVGDFTAILEKSSDVE